MPREFDSAALRTRPDGSDEELEEERRLLYVAMTRAQHQLQLLVPQRFYLTQQSARGDLHLWDGLSRFTMPQVAGHFERVCAAEPDATEPSPVANAPPIDLAARLRTAWD